MEMSEKIDQIAAALIEVQGDISDPVKNANNPHFKNDYADLSAVLKITRPALTAHGLSVAQTFDDCDHGVMVVTTLFHKSGQWIRSRLRLNPGKDTPQAYGSAITYGRRYSLAAIVGITQTDDDGNEGSDKDNRKNGRNGNGHKSPDKTVEEAQAILGGQEETAYTNDAYGRIDKFLAEKTNGSESAVKSKLRSLAKSSGVDPKLLNTIECVSKLNPEQASMIAKHIKDSEDIPF